MMISRWGPIPEEAWAIAEGAYGDTACKAYGEAIARIRDTGWQQKCMTDMSMEPDLEGEILALHGGPLDKET
ncbi:hypothetical protein [Leisingera sp. M658]|uniref:hypothetical protein n=1 Tax=Leisingera sp. M658 TaxID=2867015 RepID=UPI0021A45CD7|nr:hypothetical protein [Leisingera sp. M658]UWQ74135.1 hypothetical protein K3724_16620 [Leisingera sp. M658]